MTRPVLFHLKMNLMLLSFRGAPGKRGHPLVAFAVIMRSGRVGKCPGLMQSRSAPMHLLQRWKKMTYRHGEHTFEHASHINCPKRKKNVATSTLCSLWTQVILF